MNVCQSCKLDFGSVAAFDSHRVGKHEYLYREGLEMDPPREDGRRCLDEDEIRSAVTPSGTLLFALNSLGKFSLASSVKSGARGLRIKTIERTEDPEGDFGA